MVGFRSVREPETINFPYNGLVLIRGKNGAGKSTIFAGIAHALGYAPFPASKLQNWNEDAPVLNVGLQMQGDAFISVWRGQKPSLHISSGPSDAGVGFNTATVVQEKLNGIFGMAPDMLEALTYRPQRQRGLFINKTDAEKKEFLSSLLKLDRFETAVETSNAKAKELENLFISAHARYTDKVKEYEEAKAACVEPTYVNAEQIADRRIMAEVQVRQKKDLLEKSNRHLEILKQDSYQGVAEILNTDPEVLRLKGIVTQIQGRKDIVLIEISTQRQEEIARISAERRHVYTKIDDLNKLQAGECPTCHRPYDQQPDPAELLKYQSLAAQLQREFTDAMLERTEPRVQKLDSFMAETKDALKRAEIAAVKAFQDKLNEEIVPQTALVSDLQQEIKDLEHARWALGEEWSIEVNQNAIKKYKYDESVKRKESLQRAAGGYQALAQEHDLALKAERDFVRLVGREGFLGAIFDEILAEISAETNRLLAQIPNVSHVTIHFSSDTTTQKNKPKKEIVPIIFINGHRAAFSSGCSGGMQASIEFVVDLAVSEVISRRTGCVPGWMLIDEAFDGMDLDAKTACMEVLQVYAQQKLVLVIDHETTFKEMFAMTLDVQMVDGSTRIRTANAV
jgi:DNA repair exonuclease SbcCD ATPase subunit